DALGDIKAQPQSTTVLGIDPSKSLEDRGLVGGRNSKAVVSHGNTDVALCSRHGHRDLASLVGELQRVADQVAQHLDDAIVIAGRNDGIRSEIGRQRDALGGAGRLERLFGFFQQLGTSTTLGVSCSVPDSKLTTSSRSPTRRFIRATKRWIRSACFTE